MIKLIIHTLFACCSVSFALAQSTVVTGIVSGDGGLLEGATVYEKNAVPANGTKTDKNGSFTITLKGKSNTLEITTINFLIKEVRVENT